MTADKPYTLHLGDCLEVMRGFEADSFDSIVTDPPAGISFMSKEWDHHKGGRNQWIAWMTEIASECLRVLKPGAHALVWALPRTSHWTATAWEDAGFEVRDRIVHAFGTGMIKGLNISKAIDNEAGAEREVVGVKLEPNGRNRKSEINAQKPRDNKCLGVDKRTRADCCDITAPATAKAQQWDGWGTCLKPAVEDWYLFRKPIAERTIAANVVKHRTGGLNVKGCEVGDTKEVPRSMPKSKEGKGILGSFGTVERGKGQDPNTGRVPANLIHDGSEEVEALFPMQKSGAKTLEHDDKHRDSTCYGAMKPCNRAFESTEGSASRFFYCSKASNADREEGCEAIDRKRNDFQRESSGMARSSNDKEGERRTCSQPHHNSHPCVKSTKLMTWLCRLVTPPGGTVLDPFCGSGSTGKAAMLEGFFFVGIEQDPEYFRTAEARIADVATLPLMAANE